MKQILLIPFLLLSTACASLSIKERAVVTLNASEIALEASHDAERSFCAPNADQTQPITECTGLAASAIGLTTERHRAIARLYSRAFAVQILAAQALKAWRAGDPAPISLAEYQQVILEILAEVTKLWPSAHAVVTKTQEASVEAVSVARMIREAQ